MTHTQLLDQGFHQYDPLIGTQRDGHQPAREIAVSLHRKGVKFKNSLNIGEVLTSRRVTRGVICQHIRGFSDLPGKIGENGRRHLLLRVPGTSGESEIGELHRKTQTVLWTSMLLDHGKVLC